MPVAIALGIVSGCAVGLLNGVLLAKIGVNALIATLGTSTLVAGPISLYTANQVISIGIPESITALGSGTAATWRRSGSRPPRCPPHSWVRRPSSPAGSTSSAPCWACSSSRSA
ncbi:hypothetical protein ABC795_16260 [Blastococcus sp. HT6-30]|uniref:hypothetical protein n=1 Tax=Blastococcus sp. HT6-30 TaxID=3144843 RepID=UPI00321B5704